MNVDFDSEKESRIASSIEELLGTQTWSSTEKDLFVWPTSEEFVFSEEFPLVVLDNENIARSEIAAHDVFQILKLRGFNQPLEEFLCQYAYHIQAQVSLY